MLRAGTITGAYGIKGWVKVHALTDLPEDFFAFERWFAKDRHGYRPIAFAEGRRHGKGLIARVDGVATRDEAEALRGTDVWVPAEALPALDDGDYYWHQLENMRVWCEHEGRSLLLGEVDHLIETGANDVLVLRPCEGSIDQRERLVPYLPGQVVLAVDDDEGRMTVAWHPDD